MTQGIPGRKEAPLCVSPLDSSPGGSIWMWNKKLDPARSTQDLHTAHDPCPIKSRAVFLSFLWTFFSFSLIPCEWFPEQTHGNQDLGSKNNVFLNLKKICKWLRVLHQFYLPDFDHCKMVVWVVSNRWSCIHGTWEISEIFLQLGSLYLEKWYWWT